MLSRLKHAERRAQPKRSTATISGDFHFANGRQPAFINSTGRAAWSDFPINLRTR
jgi:hypothetical protein